MKPLILVVDDEPDIRSLVKDILEDEGYDVAVAENGAAARAAVARRAPDLVLLDIWMPDVDGISLLKEFGQSGMAAPVVMISGHGTVESAVEATRLGAFDFIEKPLSLGKLLMTVKKALAEAGGHEPAARRVGWRAGAEPVGRSAPMQRLRDQVRRAAEVDSCVLFNGEPGSGKETFARFLHQCGPRRTQPFVSFNVAPSSSTRVDEALFGREAGTEVRRGALEDAHGGTLFIDDVAELDAGCQARLLDLCTTRSFKRIGGGKRVEVDVRLLAATRFNLRDLIAAGRFRDDLYYRLSEVAFNVPALREHVDDVTDLVQHFADHFVNEERLPYRKFSLASQNALRNYSWPGNVNELRNIIHRLLLLGNGQEVGAHDVDRVLAEQLAAAGGAPENVYAMSLRDAREQFEKQYLEYHLRQTGGNVLQVAKQAGMERTHLYRKIRALGIDTKQLKEQKE
jgi:DNA-binding NtrC family response regulator